MSTHHVNHSQRQRLEQAVKQGWDDISAGRYTDVADAHLEDFIAQLGMRAALAARDAECVTVEQAASYDRWLQAKVQKAIDSPKPRLPHDQAMARVDRLLQERRQQRVAG